MSYRETDIPTGPGTHTHEGSEVADPLEAHLALIILVPAAEWPPTDPTDGVLYLKAE